MSTKNSFQIYLNNGILIIYALVFNGRMDFTYSFSLRHISTFKTVSPPLGSIESIDHSLSFDITNL